MSVGTGLDAARWTAAWAVAYNLLHHLGALPGGLGSAGGGTRWTDWIDLLTPYIVTGTALAALAATGTDRRGWTAALLGAAVYAQGHAIHLSANSIATSAATRRRSTSGTRSSATGSSTQAWDGVLLVQALNRRSR